MRKAKIRTFQERLREDLKDPELRSHFGEERTALALKISRLREKRGLSRKELDRLMGTSQQAISCIESSDYEGVSLKTLEKIAEATQSRLKFEFVPVR